MTTTTIQPSNADTRLVNTALYADTNFGTDTYASIGLISATFVTRMLVKFDHSTIPATDTCNTATLSVVLKTDYSTNACTWSVYRLLRDWGETTATWNKYDGTNAWGTAGATNATDIATTALGTSASIAADSAPGTEISISLNAAEFQKMYDGTYTNYGFLIMADSEAADNGWWVESRESATAGIRPKLVVGSTAAGSVTTSNLLLLGVG